MKFIEIKCAICGETYILGQRLLQREHEDGERDIVHTLCAQREAVGHKMSVTEGQKKSTPAFRN